MTPLVLVAPLAGWACRLDEVPDPAFAQGLVGDGVAIDPVSGELCAPCDGVVVSVHRARHACTLRAECGAEILLHVGIDSVALHGEGFRALVKDGERVRTGDVLIRFDPGIVARKARSLHTPVLLVGGDGFSVVERAVDREVQVGAFLMAIARGAADAPVAAAEATATHRARLRIAHGLHARPAAAFARCARSHGGAVTVATGTRSANGKSLTALLALDARCGDELAITASGPGGEAIARELAALVAAGLGDAIAPEPEAASAAAHDAPSAAVAAFLPGEEVRLDGVPAAPGLALGRAVRISDTGAEPEVPRDGAGPAVEHPRLAAALAEVRRELAETIAAAVARGDAAAADIVRAHVELLDDPELAAAASSEIDAGRSAAWAWQAALAQLAATLRGLGNPLLAERTADLGDVARRTLARLAGRSWGRIPAVLPEAAVLVADDLSPSELAAVPAGRLAGLCTARGGATSHVAILASGLGVPAVVALGDAALCVPDGAPIVVDGGRGRVRVFPDASTRAAVIDAIAGRAERRRAAAAMAHQPARTIDGAEIAVAGNVGKIDDAARAADAGADGSGLVRTEFLFMDRGSAPSEDEQAARYQDIADALRGRPVVIRTLDAGGDKPMAYLAQRHEDNPALGVRGVRLALRHPAMLRTQLRALLRVQPAGACRIMVPMIASLGELRAVRAVLDDERRALGVTAEVALGAMIEVPAAALCAGQLAREAEFFSIGTNDLTQYGLAMDRGNPEVAAAMSSLHPGVLRLIASTAAGARRHRRPVSVCGDAAADPCAVPILLGLGVTTLSVAPAAVAEIKAVIRTLTMSRCIEIAAQALEFASSDDVRALVVNTWPGLGAHHDG